MSDELRDQIVRVLHPGLWAYRTDERLRALFQADAIMPVIAAHDARVRDRIITALRGDDQGIISVVYAEQIVREEFEEDWP